MVSGRDPQRELEEKVRRIQDALAQLPDAASHLAAGIAAAKMSGIAVKADGRALRRAMRRHLRDERRRLKLETEKREEEERGLAHAIAFAGGSAVTLYFGLHNPAYFWMLFVSFGFAMTAAGIFTKWAKRQQDAGRQRVDVEVVPPPPLPVPAPPVPVETDLRLAAITARLLRVDAICDKLLAELKSSPEVVHQMIRKPDETVQALQAASHELARRERELRSATPEGDDARLRGERADLNARIEAEPDEVVRIRLSSALAALDDQIRGRADLLVSAARIEAEGTRILYSLESLRAQVLRTRVADTSSPEVAGDGLRHGLEQLNREMDAVATALEEVHTTETVRRQMPLPQGMRN